jgi:hypothetical protein
MTKFTYRRKAAFRHHLDLAARTRLPIDDCIYTISDIGRPVIGEAETVPDHVR